MVRSAARFLVHIGDYEKALRLLRGKSTRHSDPWVLAAEVGISSFAHLDPRCLKLGRRIVEGRDFTEFSKSELASAIATLELNEGNRRAAKKLFRQSLALPTENSVAQAEWASDQVGDLSLPGRENVPRNYEAKSLHAYRIEDWETTIFNAEKWLSDQPFSSRPASVLSYIYSGILGKHEEALEGSEVWSSYFKTRATGVSGNNMAFHQSILRPTRRGRISSWESRPWGERRPRHDHFKRNPRVVIFQEGTSPFGAKSVSGCDQPCQTEVQSSLHGNGRASSCR